MKVRHTCRCAPRCRPAEVCLDPAPGRVEGAVVGAADGASLPRLRPVRGQILGEHDVFAQTVSKEADPESIRHRAKEIVLLDQHRCQSLQVLVKRQGIVGAQVDVDRLGPGFGIPSPRSIAPRGRTGRGTSLRSREAARRARVPRSSRPASRRRAARKASTASASRRRPRQEPDPGRQGARGPDPRSPPSAGRRSSSRRGRTGVDAGPRRVGRGLRPRIERIRVTTR